MLLFNLFENLGIVAIVISIVAGGIWLAFKKLSPLIFLVFISFLATLGFFGFKGMQLITDDPVEETVEPIPPIERETKKSDSDLDTIDFSKRDYKVKDEKFWTYRTEGDWKWPAEFIESFYAKSGWSYKRSGNFIIKVSENGRSILGERNDAQSYVYEGGPIEISVNGQVCCCEKRLKLPKGVEGKNVGVLKEKLQLEISKIMLEHQDYVIGMIMECLR